MSSNENNDMKAERKPSDNQDLSEGEIPVVQEESSLYKKVKLNSEQPHKKKHDHEKEDKGYDSDEKIKHKHKHKDNSSSARDHRSDHHDHKEHKSKSEKSSEHKKKHKEHSREDSEKKHKSKSEHRKSSEDKSSKKKSHKDKDREKSKSDHDKDKNGEKKNKKKEKKKEKEDAKQMKLDVMVEQNKEKKNKSKSKEDNERKFLDFAKKYPQFVHKGRFKFPIEDRLFILYSTLLAEHIPKSKKPAPKKGLIPPNFLGDILQIWNFFNSYSDLFKFEDIQREEIYAALKYEGNDNIMLINDIHQGLLSLFVQEFIKKHRFETQKDEHENAFFILVKFLCGEETPDGDELSLIWPEFARRLVYLPWFKDVVSETGKKYLETLGEKSILGYNKLDLKTKTRMLNDLIECVHETEVFHEFLATKMEEMTTLQRQKNDLVQEIKQEEQEYYGLKNKLESMDKGKGKDEGIKGYMKNDKKPNKEEADKKEQSKYQATVARLETSLSEKQALLEEINSKLTYTTQTAQCIGLDANKSEYWVFMHEPSKIYVRHPAFMNASETEDTWYYYDKKEDVDQLVKSLNSKGLREKNLLDNLKSMLKEGVIKFEAAEDDKEEEKNDESRDEETKKDEGMAVEGGSKDEDKNKSTTSKKEKKAESQKAQQLDYEYWLAKVFEYESMVNSSDPSQTMRTTRRKFQQAQKNQLDRVKNKNPRFLDFDAIKEMILRTEEGMTTYLDRWEGHWAKPKVREETIKKIKESTTPRELGQILVVMNEGFQWSKSPIGRRGRRKKEETEGYNAEEEDEDQGDEDEDDEERSEEREEEEEEAAAEEENRYAEEALYGDESPRIQKKKKDRQLKILDESDEIQDKNSEDERDSDRSREEPQTEQNQDSGDKEQPEEETETKENNQGENTQMDIQNEEQDDEDGRRYKRVALRIWGLSNEKARRCWVNFTNKLENLTSLYFSASILCDFVDKYVAKMTARYFTQYKTFKEYLAAKKQAKREMMKERSLLDSKPNAQMNVEKLDTYKMKKNPQKEARDRAERRETRNAAKPIREGVSSRLRERNEPEEEEDEDYYKPKQDERSRAKQEKLHELLQLRRSERLQRPTTRKNLNEQQWNTECKACGEDGEVEEMCACNMCNTVYHLECAGIKKIPEGGYTCVDCLQKIASQRQTRSTTRKLHI